MKILLCEGRCGETYTPHYFIERRAERIEESPLKEVIAIDIRYACAICGISRRYGYETPPHLLGAQDSEAEQAATV